MMNHRRKISPEQKEMILREHLENDVSITDLAEKYKIHPNLIGRQNAIIAYCRDKVLLGYRRLACMMIGEDIAYVCPATTY